MIAVNIQSVGLMAPGLPGWQTALPVLRGETPYQAEAMPPLQPRQLKPNERRRTTQTIKLALVTADDALSQVEQPAKLLSVFASTEGDLQIIDQICRALTQTERPVSPTQFHNSVHNAPAGYWSIATGYRQASTSIGGLQGTFAAGLLDAAVQSVCESKPVLLVAYDQAAPEALSRLILNTPSFAAALLLSPASGTPDAAPSLASLRLQPVDETRETTLPTQPLEQLRGAQPSARALPLLVSLARRETGKLLLPYLPGRGLQVEVLPC